MQKQTVGLKFHLIIPQRVTIIHDTRIKFNENKDVLKDLNKITSTYDWFPYEYINAEVNNKLDKTKGRLVGDEMEKESIDYVEYLIQDSNWLNMITIEVDKFLVDSEYINFFMQMYTKCIKDDGST